MTASNPNSNGCKTSKVAICLPYSGEFSGIVFEITNPALQTALTNEIFETAVAQTRKLFPEIFNYIDVADLEEVRFVLAYTVGWNVVSDRGPVDFHPWSVVGFLLSNGMSWVRSQLLKALHEPQRFEIA